MDDNRLHEDGVYQNLGNFYFLKFSYWWRV
jgi:hypothetical protein